jgi:hypothetical protein
MNSGTIRVGHRRPAYGFVMTTTPTQRDDRLEPVMIRMPADLHAAIKAKAETEERSMAGAIRHALREYVDQG